MKPAALDPTERKAVMGVGALFALMWISSAFAALYHAIDLGHQERLNQNGAPA